MTEKLQRSAVVVSTRVPPKQDYSYQVERIQIGRPATDLTPKEFEEWINHLRIVSVKLYDMQRSVAAREHAFDARKYKWSVVIRGLKRTVMWQASVLEEKGYPAIQEKVKKLFRWVPESIPAEVRKDMKESGEKDPPPFLTEAFLYPTLGKDDARTLLSLVGDVAESVGMERHPHVQ
jgi:hypothetical protein